MANKIASLALNTWQDISSDHGSKTLASAALVDPSKLLQELKYRPDDFFLGKDFCGRLYGIPGVDDTHVIVCGGTRADKGTAISSTLLNRRSSVYFTSTKPQDVRKIAPRRGRGNQYCDGMGQACYCWDGHGIVDCDDVIKVKVNVIGGVGGFVDPTKSNCVSRAMRLAICLLPLSKGNHEDYFTQDARSLLVCLILYVASAPQFEGRRHIGTVYDLLLAGDVATWEALKALNLLPKN